MYKVLFVDDDPTISFIIRHYHLWEELGFILEETAENGEHALMLLSKKKFDLVITDIRMPKIDGLELVRKMRQIGDKTCVLLASTYSEFQYAKEGIRLGALDYIEKPFTEQKLSEGLQLARTYLDGNRVSALGDTPRRTLFTETKVGQILQMLLEGEPGAGNMMSELTERAVACYPKDISDIRQELIKLLTDLWENITEKYTWLKAVEQLDFTLNQEQLKEDIVPVIEYFEEIIEKYDLSKNGSVIPKACQYMAKHIREDHLIDQVSEEVSLSRDYLGRIFKRRCGISLSEFITLQKMYEACKMLVETNMKIYEISAELGYSTVDYFTKIFRNCVGVAPVRYRKNHRGS